jgi:hypothetical protein
MYVRGDRDGEVNYGRTQVVFTHTYIVGTYIHIIFLLRFAIEWYSPSLTPQMWIL